MLELNNKYKEISLNDKKIKYFLIIIKVVIICQKASKIEQIFKAVKGVVDNIFVLNYKWPSLINLVFETVFDLSVNFVIIKKLQFRKLTLLKKC